MERLSDTSPEAERVLVEVFRRMSPADKWLRVGELFTEANCLHAVGERLRNPQATDLEIHESWLRKVLGKGLAEEVMSSTQYRNWVERTHKNADSRPSSTSNGNIGEVTLP